MKKILSKKSFYPLDNYDIELWNAYLKDIINANPNYNVSIISNIYGPLCGYCCNEPLGKLYYEVDNSYFEVKHL